MQAYNRKAAAHQQLQTKHNDILLVYKSNRIKEDILKSEVKIKWLKNLEEKKQLCTLYLQVNRVNIIQVWLALRGQAETNKVLIIQHCVTFSLVNPKRLLKTKYLPWGRGQARAEKNWAKSEEPAAARGSVWSEYAWKTSRTFWLKHSFQFFLCMRF